MVNKNDNIISIGNINNNYYKMDNMLFTKSFIEMLGKYNNNKEMQEKEDYQNDVIMYINKIYENSIKKQYNPIIVNLYNNGQLDFNNKMYQLKDFYIIFNDQKNNFVINYPDDIFNKKNNDYNKAIKFIDTTAFINLIKSKDVIIQNNVIKLNNIDLLNNIINNWDGYLHNETKETDAIINKKMIKDN